MLLGSVFGIGELHKKLDESIEFIGNYLCGDNITCYYYSVIILQNILGGNMLGLVISFVDYRASRDY